MDKKNEKIKFKMFEEFKQELDLVNELKEILEQLKKAPYQYKNAKEEVQLGDWEFVGGKVYQSGDEKTRTVEMEMVNKKTEPIYVFTIRFKNEFIKDDEETLHMTVDRVDYLSEGGDSTELTMTSEVQTLCDDIIWEIYRLRPH